MKNQNKYLKLASIFYLLFALFVIPYITAFGGILLTIGIIIMSYSFLPPEVLKQKKVIIIILAVISILLNILSAVFLFLSLEELSSYNVEKTNSPPEDDLSSEIKRIDLLLKIGLSMILVSGVLFATTSWESITDIMKLIFLILIGFVFLGLSRFSEEKLKIEKTAKAYYILGLSFFIFTWVGIGVFGTISPWFSYTGLGKNLVYFITFILLGTMCYLINKKYPSKEYEYFICTCTYLSLYHILTFIGLDLLATTLVITIISLLINIFLKDNRLTTLSEVTHLYSYLYTPIIITQAIDNPTILVTITSLITIVNVLYLSAKYKDSVYNIISILVSYTLIFTSILNYEVDHSASIIFVCISVLYFLINHNKLNNSKTFIITNQIVYNLCATFCILVTDNLLIQVIFAVIYGVINHLNCFITNSKNTYFDLYYQPVVIWLVLDRFLNIVSEYIYDINIAYTFGIISLVYILIYHFEENKKIRKIYQIAMAASLTISTIINIEECTLINSVITTFASLYLYKTVIDNNNKKYPVIYVFILINVFVTTGILSIDILPSILASIILLLIYGALTYLIRDEKLKKINYISLAVPLYNLVNELSIQGDIKTVLYNIFSLYILFLIITFFIKEKEEKDLLSTIGLTILTLGIIFEQSLMIGIYVGLVGIGTILLTYNKKNYKKLFYCGVAITIINIIVQLGDYWTKIPLWLYLLLVGGGIIGFVTYKEANRKEQPKTKINKEVIKEKSQQDEYKTEVLEDFPLDVEIATFCPHCGTQNKNKLEKCSACGEKLIIARKKNL